MFSFFATQLESTYGFQVSINYEIVFIVIVDKYMFVTIQGIDLCLK